MDILAALASDPTALPLWAVLAFAAGMYPVGMLFGCQSCCLVCQSCCRDEVGQVVIDFALEGTGEQLAKATPWGGWQAFSDQSLPMRVDPLDEWPIKSQNLANRLPGFIAEGQTSGARWLLPALVNNDGTLSPLFNTFYAAGMGNAERSDFVDGEAVTLTPVPAQAQTQAPNATATVGDCPIETFPGVLSSGFTGTAGKWEYPTDNPVVDLHVLCQADEGTVIFDVESHDDRQPEYCDDCMPSVRRTMSHPGSFLLDPCQRANQSFFNLTFEQSRLEVEVDVMGYGPRAADNCAPNITAQAARYWRGHGFGGACVKETTYTISPDGQDCSPFSAWPSETQTTGPGNYEEDLVSLSATSCFGSGFFAVGTEPAGVPGVDNGPLTAADIVNGGSGYAVKGRVEPTSEAVEITSVNGSGAELVIVWSQGEDECGRPVWSVESVEMASGSGDDGGSGYLPDETLTLSVSPPAFEVTPAVLQAVTGRQEPEVVLAWAGGSGASLTVSFTKADGPPPTWSIDDVTILDGGSGYVWGEYFSFEPATPEDAGLASVGTLETQITPPSLELYGGTGTSAVLTVTLISNGGAPETWGVDSVSITDGGAGYEVGDQFSVNLAAGDVEVSPAYVIVTAVNGSGAITGVSVSSPGQYYHETGAISAFNFFYTGEYYRSGGALQGVTVQFGGGGAYYQESDTEPAIVADITIEVTQKSPSNGTGAAISAVVDDDVTSETFGKVTGLTFDNGGDEYLAVHFEPGVCSGPGGVYRAAYLACGGLIVEDLAGRGFLFRRGCPDYTYDITIQPAGS